MSNQTIATYLPDCLVITLKHQFDAFADPENVKGLVGAEQIGFFFHEWTHYLHNVSTIHGLSAFGSHAALWSNFRRTISADGFSSGSGNLDEGFQESIRQIPIFLSASRLIAKSGLPTDISIFDITVESATHSTVKIANSEAEITTITCNLLVKRNNELLRESVEIGTHEILEGAAWMLESKITLALGGISPVVLVAPYQLVKILVRSRFPDISDDTVIKFVLSALQDSDPPGNLWRLLEQVRLAVRSGECPENVLLTLTKKSLEVSKSWVMESITTIKSIFPNDEPMARAVISTSETISNNLELRRNNPYFEFDIIEQVKKSPQSLSDAIEKYGCCTVIQQRTGADDTVARDLMYDLVPSNQELEFGWRKMHASFRFVVLHYASGEFISTENVSSPSSQCPFYTICNLKLRVEKPAICKQTPWKSVNLTDQDGACWYAAAVISIRPPQV